MNQELMNKWAMEKRETLFRIKLADTLARQRIKVPPEDMRALLDQIVRAARESFTA
jgi:hypothetical protein